MTVERIYLDWNATAPLRPQALAAMLAALDEMGNPASIHAEGRKAHAIVERARADVAALVGAEPPNVIFTSGATEAAAHALTPEWSGGGRICRLFVSAIEHPCVLTGGRFAARDTESVPVTPGGVADLVELKQRLEADDLKQGRPLVALMAANNETGIIQPVAEAAALVHAVGGLVVCDAVQYAVHLPTDIRALGADVLLLSAHKLGGPKGVGALVLADERIAPAPLLTGGGQERRQRAGTENVAAIAGFGAAAKATKAASDDTLRIAALRDRLETALNDDAGGLKVYKYGLKWSLKSHCTNNSGLARLPNTTLLAMPGVSAQMLLMQLDLEGFAVSAGAACSSGKLAASHVLAAMGLPPDIAGGAIRVSIGKTTTAGDIERFIAAWTEIDAARAKREAA